MTILALEFSSPQRSVAVLAGSERGCPPPQPHSSRTDPSSHSPGSESFKPAAAEDSRAPLAIVDRRLGHMLAQVIESSPGNSMKPLGMIEEALRQAGMEREQVECLAIGLGPGSYAGIRVAIALAQGWQLARGVKLLGVSSAEAIAAEAAAADLRGRVSVVIDAQRNEFYLATWDIGPGAQREIEPLRLVGFAEVQAREKAGASIVGPEVRKWFGTGRQVFPRAGTLGRLATGRSSFVASETLEPIYLRETKFVKAPPPRVLPV